MERLEEGIARRWDVRPKGDDLTRLAEKQICFSDYSNNSQNSSMWGQGGALMTQSCVGNELTGPKLC